MHASCESPWHSLAKHCILDTCFLLTVPFRGMLLTPQGGPRCLAPTAHQIPVYLMVFSTFLCRAFTAHYLLTPVDTERRHIIVVEGFLLVIAEHDQHVGCATLQSLSNLGNALLVGGVPLLEDLWGQLLRNPGVDFRQQLLIGDMLAIRHSIQALVVLVFLAPLQPVFRGEAQLRAM